VVEGLRPLGGAATAARCRSPAKSTTSSASSASRYSRANRASSCHR
jgi:hypothetical protein